MERGTGFYVCEETFAAGTGPRIQGDHEFSMPNLVNFDRSAIQNRVVAYITTRSVGAGREKELFPRLRFGLR